VVRGFTPEEGVEYDETFALVFKSLSYKALFANGVALGLQIEANGRENRIPIQG